VRRGPWECLSSREVYRNPWLRLREDQVVRPDGQPGLYGVVELTAAIGVVALTADERVTLVGQYRYPTERYSWEIVAGFAAPGEDPAAAAARELREETGLTATRWSSLGECQVSNSVTDQIGYLFLAEDLRNGAPAPDPTEALAVEAVPLADAVVGIAGREISQALTLVGLYRAWFRRRGGSAP
jgi:8-oxo-dGTP pyrophosphatase MutT (NUDIX family)